MENSKNKNELDNRCLEFENKLNKKYKRKIRLNRKMEEKVMKENRVYKIKKENLEDKKDNMQNSRKTLICKMGIILLMAIIIVFSIHSLVFGADDPLNVINNLSEFIFGLIRAVGMIILTFGIVQVGMSLKSHDPSQRANGIMTLSGGVVITFAKEILNLIIGG